MKTLALLALLALPQDTDLRKLEIDGVIYGAPVQSVDLQGKVVLWRTWSG